MTILPENKIIWITGASSGLGKALALNYSRQGNKLILSARSVEHLNLVKERCCELGAIVYIIPFDLTQSKEIDTAIEIFKSHIGNIDILINCGGIGQRSLATETAIEVEKRIFETNYWGTVYFTKKLLPTMIENQKGHIVVVSSLSALYGFSLRSTYSASKHALLGYFESLALELKNLNIHVTIVCPGRLEGDFSFKALNATGDLYKKLDHSNGYSLNKAAHKIAIAVKLKKHMIVFGKKEIWLYYIKRLSVRLFYFICFRIDPKS